MLAFFSYVGVSLYFRYVLENWLQAGKLHATFLFKQWENEILISIFPRTSDFQEQITAIKWEMPVYASS